MPRFMPVITHRNFVADRPPPPDIRFKPAGSLLDSLPNLSEEPVFYPRKMGDPPSPTSTHYSDASTRRNSIDLDPSSFGPYFAHRQHPSHQSQQASIYFPPETVSPPPLESSRPPMAILQSTRGGTAALTPDLAAQLTEAQIQLSLRKKQRDSIPPVGYICRLCAIEGHWMENCILYKSNKYPQYNNAARAVALNIISPDSQVVLNSLPVVQQPKRLFTPKFFAAEKLRQLAVHEQQRQSCDSAQTRGFHTQQMHQSTFPSSSPTDESCSLAFGFTEASHISPRSGSRFEQIWKSA
ncbi:hypothetical protein HDU83_002772 [Entophlyctis luteolus]|nr:hypothetical protein HDU83_002772 [Entophlyctis luteolus]